MDVRLVPRPSRRVRNAFANRVVVERESGAFKTAGMARWPASRPSVGELADHGP